MIEEYRKLLDQIYRKSYEIIDLRLINSCSAIKYDDKNSFGLFIIHPIFSGCNRIFILNPKDFELYQSDEVRCFDMDTEYDIKLISEIKNLIEKYCPNYANERIIAGKDYRESLKIEKYKN
jgi:hypothetical protein